MEASENTRRESAFTTTNRAWGDSLIMIVILAVLNIGTVGLADWGWMTLNPSPWLLVPLFVGARYGFRWGVIVGFTVALMIFVGRAIYTVGHDKSASLSQIFSELFSEHLYFFLILPGIGFLTGETQGLLTRKLTDAEAGLEKEQEQRQTLEADLDIAEESRFQLQEKLALHGAEHSSLDRQLRALFEPSAGAIFPNLLRLLRDLAALNDAAIYAVNGDQLERIALLGAESALPESLPLATCEIARLSLERKALTTIKELWQETPEPVATHIAALPWLGGGGKVAAVLLIHRMSFLGTTWRNFHRIQMVCRWVARYVDLRVQTNQETSQLAGNTSALITTSRALQATLHDAQNLHREWKLPSTLASFAFTEPVTESVAKMLPAIVGSVMRPTDVGALEGPDTQPTFRVLMPMEGVDEAEVLLNTALQAIARIPQLLGKVMGSLSMTDEFDAVESAS